MSRRTLAAVGGIKTASKQGWETDKGRENEGGERERDAEHTPVLRRSGFGVCWFGGLVKESVFGIYRT